MPSPLLAPPARAYDILAIGEPMMEFAEVTRGSEKLYLPGHGGDTSNAIIAAPMPKREAVERFIASRG